MRRVFNATRFEEAGKRYRELAKEADSMHTEERIHRIAKIFACFHNPDKETVLTPWRVVNMHLSDTLGGYCFFNEKFDGPNQKNIVDEKGEVVDTVETDDPRFVERGEVTHEVFGNSAAKILEINSKTGLYPLYVTYSLYRQRMKDFYNAELIEEKSVEEEQVVWDDIVKNNIYVLCNTPMAERITRRTLFGFRKVKGDHIKSDKIVEKAMTNLDELAKVAKVINSVGYWKRNKSKEEMKFTAIVGNPPYQVNVGKTKDNYGIVVFNDFVEIAKQISPSFISMIMPSRWFTGGRGLEEFRKAMLNDERIAYIHDFVNSNDCFPGVDIAGGIQYFLWDKNHKGKCLFSCTYKGKSTEIYRKLNEYPIFIRYNNLLGILRKIRSQTSQILDESYISSQTPFGFISSFKGKSTSFQGSLELFGSNQSKTYVQENEVSRNKDKVDKYKVIFTKAAPGGGRPDKNGMHIVLTSLQVLYPYQICTQTFLVGGTFDNRNEAENYKKYLSTKFVRFLLVLSMTSQDLSMEKFQFVPLQNFTLRSDIDWSKSISEIDQQLYVKYHLNDKEIAFIEKMIKPME